jgi:bZIP transcription factor
LSEVVEQDLMNSPSDAFAHAHGDSSFDADTFLNPALLTSEPTGYPSGNMLAFAPPFQPAHADSDMTRSFDLQPRIDMSSLSTSPQLSIGGWSDRNTSIYSCRQGPTSSAGLSLQMAFAEPFAFQSQSIDDTKSPQTAFSAHSQPDANAVSGALRNVDAKPQSLGKRSIDTESQPAPKKGRGGIKSRSSKAQEEVKSEYDEAKREKFLERNRVAASKCRQKKKEWTSQLEGRARELTKDRHVLTATVAMLKNELLELKCKCLEHSDCQCGLIQDYLKKAVGQMSPTKVLYTGSDVLDRRRSEVSSASLDDAFGGLTTSRPPSLSIETNPSSPSTELDIEAKVTSALGGSLNRGRQEVLN